jgi:hypothetical protein
MKNILTLHYWTFCVIQIHYFLRLSYHRGNDEILHR